MRLSRVRRTLMYLVTTALVVTGCLWLVADQLTAGPLQTEGFGGGNAGANNQADNTNTKLVSYLEANQGNTKYLVAVPSSMSADSIILATNKPVMAMGGFSGSDPILTTNQLASLVAQGTVRFFLLTSFNIRQIPSQILDQIPQQFRSRLQQGSFGGFGQQSTLTTWMTPHCTKGAANLSQSPSTSSSTGGGFGPSAANQLYNCATTH